MSLATPALSLDWLRRARWLSIAVVACCWGGAACSKESDTKQVAPKFSWWSLVFVLALVACEARNPSQVRGHFREHGALHIALYDDFVCGVWLGGEAYCTTAYGTDQYQPVPWLADATQIVFGRYEAPFAACIRLASGRVRCSKFVKSTAEESELADVLGLENDIVDISAGSMHACAVRASGGVPRNPCLHSKMPPASRLDGSMPVLALRMARCAVGAIIGMGLAMVFAEMIEAVLRR